MLVEQDVAVALRVRSGVHRQPYPEGRAIADRRFDVERAAEQSDELACDREPKPGAGNRFAARRQLAERLENALLVSGFDSWPLIGNHDLVGVAAHGGSRSR